VKFINYLITAFLFSLLTFSFAYAQESEPVVIDEVIAQVNEGVITLSRVKRERQDAIDTLMRSGKTEAVAKAEVDSKQGELIANLINEELVMQKGKELGMEEDIEASLNRRFLEIAKEQGAKNLEELYRKMRENGINPDEIRSIWRKQAMRESVWNREVDAKIYHGLANKELTEYFEKNKSKFIKPESFTLSEIFLGFAGRNEAAVRAKAKDLVQQLRGGADFVKIALENSERPDIKTNQGKLGTFTMNDLKDNISIPLKGVKAGQVTDPIEVEEGLLILRVDERIGAAAEAKFVEDDVRRMITYERAPQEVKKYMMNLRRDSYIKISESYRATVSPVLYADERSDKPAEKGGK
jgi:parvulin-like peptidyl-prolyl isomerase